MNFIEFKIKIENKTKMKIKIEKVYRSVDSFGQAFKLLNQNHHLWMQEIDAHIDHDSDSGSSRNSRGDDIRSMCAAIIVTRTTS